MLKHIVDTIDAEKWVSRSTDVKGDIYEKLLQKNAEEIIENLQRALEGF